MALGDFDKVIKVNLIGSFNMLRLATAPMSKLEPLATGERGVVISTASVAAYDGQIGQAAYSGLQGRHRRDDAADRARTGAVRHPHADHCTGPVPDAAIGRICRRRRRICLPPRSRSRTGSATPTSSPRWRCT